MRRRALYSRRGKPAACGNPRGSGAGRGVRAPRIRVPYAIAYSAAIGAELTARLRGNEPFITRDGVRMSRRRMYFNSAKASRKLGYKPRPARQAIADAVGWFKKNGYLQ